GISHPEAVVINIPNEPYHHPQPDEFRTDPHHNDIPYDWNQVDR
ncbi:MAG: dTDP-4-dehydrorhamnose 3,5-epimerase, partial [Candidatus Omnitrophica bacterium]|nr:dTDP-4-dehydrorhamnose 3,5-epimerase [Candidatus Omnitrophota bacterium]